MTEKTIPNKPSFFPYIFVVIHIFLLLVLSVYLFDSVYDVCDSIYRHSMHFGWFTQMNCPFFLGWYSGFVEKLFVFKIILAIGGILVAWPIFLITYIIAAYKLIRDMRILKSSPKEERDTYTTLIFPALFWSMPITLIFIFCLRF